MTIKICLDAGHYGKYNQSPVLKTYYESDFNWKLHLLLKKYLEEYGIIVTTTRESKAKDMGLSDRGKCSKGCDLFLSLHANWAERESADHVVVYEMLNKKKHDLAVKLATIIGKTMGTTEPYDIRTKKSNSGNEWYGVLNGCSQVGNENGMILEHSFYSNKKMATWMMNDSNIDKLAKAEADTIATYYGLKKQTTTVVEVKTYKVVTNLPTYSNEDNAKSKKNAKGTYAPGTYYIYIKYPDGVDGMLNITKDKTGTTPGSWINPSENVIPKVVEEHKQEEVKKEEVKVEEPEKVTPEDIVVDTPIITEPEVLPEATPDDATNTDIATEVPKDEVVEPEVKGDEKPEPPVVESPAIESPAVNPTESSEQESQIEEEEQVEEEQDTSIENENSTLLFKLLKLLIELLNKLFGKNK